MEKESIKKANAALIAAIGKKLPGPDLFKTGVIDLYDVDNDSDRASVYAKRAIARSLGIHTGLLDASEIKACRSDIEEASKNNKDLAVVMIAEGCYSYYCEKDYPKAMNYFGKASQKEPENYEPLFYQLMVNKALGNCREVKSTLDKLIKIEMKDPLVLTNIGLCYGYLHDFEKAYEYHQKAIDINKDFEAAYLNKAGILLLKDGDISGARTTYSSVFPEPVEQLILLDMYDGNYKEAFDRAVLSNPTDFTAIGTKNVYLGNISLLLNDPKAVAYFDEALNELKHGLKAHNSDAELHALAGMAYAGKKNRALAMIEGEEALNIAKKAKDKILESEMALYLAKIYTTVGEFEKADQLINFLLVNCSLFSENMLHLNPVWKPLLGNVQYKAIVANYKTKVLTF